MLPTIYISAANITESTVYLLLAIGMIAHCRDSIANIPLMLSIVTHSPAHYFLVLDLSIASRLLKSIKAIWLKASSVIANIRFWREEPIITFCILSVHVIQVNTLLNGCIWSTVSSHRQEYMIQRGSYGLV
jgi:hypothetical protein